MKTQITKELVKSSILPLALLLVGCSNNDQTTSSGRFSEWDVSILPTTTRATIEDLEDGFLVHATSGLSPTSFEIRGATYQMGDEDWEWANEESYSWPSESDGYPMTFYAYYLGGGYTVTDSDDASALSVDVTVGEVGSQIDVLSATGESSIRPVGGKLSLEFNHILSRTDLDVVAVDGSTIHLQSVDFVGVDDTNNYDLLTSQWGDTTSIGDEEVSEVSYSYLTLANPAVEISSSDELTSSYGSLYLMPQTLIPWDTSTTLADARVELVFRSTDDDDDAEDQIGYTYASDHPNYTAASGLSATEPLFVKIAVPLISTDGGYDWSSGSSYDYTVTLGGYGTNNGYFASEYYYDADGDPTTLEISGAEVGDEVTPGDICFTVSLIDWSTDDAVALNE